MSRFVKFALAVVCLGFCLSAAVQAAALYGTSHGGATAPSTLWRICPTSGEAFPVGPIGFNNVGSIAFHPFTGVLYGVAKDPEGPPMPPIPRVLIEIDPLTGAGTAIGPLLNSWNLNGGGHFDLSFRPSDGALFLLAFLPDTLVVMVYEINTATGEATAIGATGPNGTGNAMSFENDGKLWMVQNTGVETLYELNPADGGVLGAGTALSFNGFPALNHPRANGMVGEHAGGPTYLSLNDGSAGSGPNYLALLDTANATVNHIGLSVPGLDGLALDTSGTLRMEQSIHADASGLGWEWQQPIGYEYVIGTFSLAPEIGSYLYFADGSGSGASLATPQPVPSGSANWYLLRPRCADASWSSGGIAECPAPACAGGTRDSLLP